MRKFLHTAAAVALLTCSAAASAQDFTYADFSDTSNLKINGDATTAVVDGSTVLRVSNANDSQAGSVFSLEQISLADDYSFATQFTFNFNHSGGYQGWDIYGADGLVFTVQTNSNEFGGGGGGIGYAGLAPSIGVEFDSYDNGFHDDYSGNHVGINFNGNVNSVYQVESPFLFDSGASLTAWIEYNSTAGLLEVFLNDSVLKPLTPLISYGDLNLAGVLGGGNEAFVGFTSGTGAGWANHDVTSWQFNNSYDPISNVPEPATWAMMLVGFGGIGYSIRRRRKTLPLARLA